MAKKADKMSDAEYRKATDAMRARSWRVVAPSGWTCWGTKENQEAFIANNPGRELVLFPPTGEQS